MPVGGKARHSLCLSACLNTRESRQIKEKRWSKVSLRQYIVKETEKEQKNINGVKICFFENIIFPSLRKVKTGGSWGLTGQPV